MSSEIIKPVADLAYCAEQITKTYNAIRSAEKKALENAFECGKALIQAKEQVKHGTWIDWVESNCPFSVRQAQKYIQIAEHFELIESNTHSGSHLSINEAAAIVADSKKPEPIEDAEFEVTPEPDPEPEEFEYIEKDESEPLEPGEIDCGPVEEQIEEPSTNGKPEPVDPEWMTNDVQEIRNLLTQFIKRLNAVESTPGNELLTANRNRIKLDLDNVKSCLKSCLPYIECAYCSDGCEICGQRGWMNELSYSSLPQEEKDGVSPVSTRGNR